MTHSHTGNFNAHAFLQQLIADKPLHQRISIDANRSLNLLRLDKLDAHLSGNKAFKLAGHLEQFYASPYSCLLSFGGAYSNHLHALASVCKQQGIPLIAYVRGYRHLPLTPTLMDLTNWHSELHFLNKQTYRQRHDPSYQQALSSKHQAYVINEGGGGIAGLQGGKQLAKLCQGYQHIWLAAGTGTTALSLAPHLKANVSLHIVNVVADNGELARTLTNAMPANCNWQLLEASQLPELGRFAYRSETLLQFIRYWDSHNLPLDPIYTAKLLYIYLRQPHQANSLIIHSGGLQGRR